MARNHTAVSATRVEHTLAQMKAVIANGLPFVFGFAVFESLESKEVKEDGKMPMPAGWVTNGLRNGMEVKVTNGRIC